MPTISRNYKSGGVDSSEVDLDLYPLNTSGVVTPSSGLLNAPDDLTPPLTISTTGTKDNYEQKAVDISGDTACRSFTTAFGFSPWLVQGTAAYAKVQTSPTDATAGRLLNNETTHIGGNVNYTGANYQPQDVQGVNVPQFMQNNSGGAHSSGTSGISGSDLKYARGLSDTGLWGSSSLSVSGTWKYVGRFTNQDQDYGLYVRIA